ncbi:MAG: ABC transporter permease subunit [Acidimicrobiia bacterium]|nr:ABC transporter permease subunit [Acidimicrobiia bacterium]
MSSATYPRATATDASAHPTRTHAIRAIAVKDFTAVRRSKGVLLPMLIVPFLLLVVLPLAVGIAARNAHPPDVSSMLHALPGGLARPILLLPRRERLLVLVDGYLVAPLFLIVPLMLAAVLAADAFAGEKERKTLEGLLHQPVPDRDLFLAKLLGAFVPAVAISWVGFACFAAVVNATAWPVAHHLIVPTRLWAVVIFWVAPAVAALGLGVMVRVSARASSTQEANQLGGAVILPLIFLAVGQSTGLLLVTLPAAIGIGGVVWAVALFLVGRGAQRFRRDRIARTI